VFEKNKSQLSTDQFNHSHFCFNFEEPVNTLVLNLIMSWYHNDNTT
jgi:hypothetical protein